MLFCKGIKVHKFLNQIFSWRFLMVIIAFGIVAYSIYFTNRLAANISTEETHRIKTYAMAIESISRTDAGEQDMSFQLEMISENKSIPVILTDSQLNVIDSRNLSVAKNDSMAEPKLPDAKVKELIQEFKNLHAPIRVELPQPQFVYYGESTVLKQLKYFPYFLFAIILIFITIVFIAYNSANKSLQNRVWVGMSKETAHQLGTPLMSMVGWLEYLRGNGQEMIADEMQKDVDRLQLIADRFSKIGSTPQLDEQDILLRLQNVVEYMRRRSSKKVVITLNANGETEVPIMLNGPLFDWVIENLIRNSLDAMNGEGKIHVELVNKPAEVIIQVTDTGKGIPQNQMKKVFRPGFTTKKRGWGLGLSLAKRIVTKYHHGHIMVTKSEPNVATTFTIILDR
jgi:nitrogen-specific signal transduction histidine kinase